MTLAIEKSEYFLPVKDLIASDATEREKKIKDRRSSKEGDRKESRSLLRLIRFGIDRVITIVLQVRATFT